MSTQTAFHRGVHPLLQLLLPGKEEAVLAAQPDRALRERIEQLAAKSTEGELTAEAGGLFIAFDRERFTALLDSRNKDR